MTIRICGPLIPLLLLSGCGTFSGPQDGAPDQPLDVSSIPDAVPRDEPFSKYGNPPHYEVHGKRYYTLDSNKGYIGRGIASWYGTKFHGRRTSSGEPYDMYAMTAAHKTLPLPTYAEVENLENGRKIVVKINDRGPFKEGRIIDLSYAAATKLGITASGTAEVEVRAIDPTNFGKSAASGPLYLQVGAYRDRDNAERMRSRLQQAAIDSIRVQRAPGDEVYRVRIGPLADERAAGHVAAKLTALGITESTLINE